MDTEKSLHLRAKRMLRYVIGDFWLHLWGASAFERYVRKCRIFKLPDIIHNGNGNVYKQTAEQERLDQQAVRQAIIQVTTNDSLH